MQDIHSIGTGTSGGGAGRFFSGVGGSNGGDRRLRPYNHHPPPAMKCPRCDSLNTKFCYYNNYNLSQPRHFCKSCRRYWTKGGVLRNVPVGGGCRKTKRSKSKSNGVRKSSNSHSSSDSSTLTEKTTKTTTTTTTTNPVFNFHETNTTSTGFVNIPNLVTRNPSFEPFPVIPEIGTFTSLITSHTPLGFNDISPANQTDWLETEQQTIAEELKVQSPLGGFTEDWNNGTDQALFDLTVDQSYWNQAHWNDNDLDHDHHLNYLP